MQNTTKHSTRSGRLFDRVLHVESKQRTFGSFCYYKYMLIYSTIQYMYKTKYAFGIILQLIPMYTLISEVHVYTKVTLKGELPSSPTSSFCRASGYESQGCRFESKYGKDFFITFSLSKLSSQVDYAHTNEIKHDFIRGNRCIQRMII